jgi:hypothetical protein
MMKPGPQVDETVAASKVQCVSVINAGSPSWPPPGSACVGKNENRTALVTVQEGTLSIPQLVAELSRLIPER